MDIITGPAVCLDGDLFAPGLTIHRQENQQNASKELRQLLFNGILAEKRYQPLMTYLAFVAALEQLKASISPS